MAIALVAVAAYFLFFTLHWHFYKCTYDVIKSLYIYIYIFMQGEREREIDSQQLSMTHHSNRTWPAGVKLQQPKSSNSMHYNRSDWRDSPWVAWRNSGWIYVRKVQLMNNLAITTIQMMIVYNTQVNHWLPWRTKPTSLARDEPQDGCVGRVASNARSYRSI